jgi:D-sedoheptulose 7-phosphate isomerase
MWEDSYLIDEYLENIKKIADSIDHKDINKACVIIYEAWMKDKTVFICGNGGSASTASHFANDLLKLGVKTICLNDNPAIITALTNDNGFDNIYEEQLKNLFEQKDVLIVLSVHGGAGKDKAGAWSQNLINAVRRARVRYGKSIGLLGYDGGLLKSKVDVPIIVGNSTPLTESWHLMVAHLICLILKDYQPLKRCLKCNRMYKIDVLECPGCKDGNYALVGGMIGNIEELKKG